MKLLKIAKPNFLKTLTCNYPENEIQLITTDDFEGFVL